jgi:hypothetical protein
LFIPICELYLIITKTILLDEENLLVTESFHVIQAEELEN